MNARFAEHPLEVEQYQQRFHTTMEFVKNTFPYGFRRKSSGKDTPRTRFEAIAIGSFLALHENPNLFQEKPNVDWLTDESFERVIGSDGANVVSRLRGRISFVRDHLLGTGG